MPQRRKATGKYSPHGNCTSFFSELPGVFHTKITGRAHFGGMDIIPTFIVLAQTPGQNNVGREQSRPTQLAAKAYACPISEGPLALSPWLVA